MVSLTIPAINRPQLPPKQDTGFPLKRLICWSTFAVWVFSIPRLAGQKVFLHYVQMPFMLIIFLLAAGLISPSLVFLPGRDQTRDNVWKVYGSAAFVGGTLLGIFGLLS